jgi:hypothetical protein
MNHFKMMNNYSNTSKTKMQLIDNGQIATVYTWYCYIDHWHSSGIRVITRASVYSWQRPVPDSASCRTECRQPAHTCWVWNKELYFNALTQKYACYVLRRRSRISAFVGEADTRDSDYFYIHYKKHRFAFFSSNPWNPQREWMGETDFKTCA